jgi:hypothetical protein
MHRARMRAVRTAMITALGALAGTSYARADEPPAPPPCADKVEARESYARGRHLAEKRLFVEALNEFTRAQALCPAPEVLRAIGSMNVELGRPLPAVEALVLFIQQKKDALDAEDRAALDETIDEQLLRADAGLVSVTAPVEHAELTVDGASRGRLSLGGPVILSAGPHRIGATSPGQEADQVRITVRPGSRLSVALVFRSIAPAHPSATANVPPPSAVPPPPRDEEHLFTPWQTAGIVVGAVGIALEIATLVHFRWNHGRWEDWKAEDRALRSRHEAPDYVSRQHANNARVDSLEAASVVTGTLAISGALVVGAGTMMFFGSGGNGRDHSGADGVHAAIGFGRTW